MSDIAIKRALVSVSDKAGVVELCSALHALGVEILSTGGTAKALRAANIPVKDVSEHTGFPEMMDGRVKTLHPKVHGGLLALRDDAHHMAAAREHGIGMIDMVVVNLYPFEQTVAKPGVAREEAIEQIDIGGPSMVRSAAKNHAFVAVLTDPKQYPDVIAELRRTDGKLGLATRKTLCVQAFLATSAYDTAIAGWLAVQEGAQKRITRHFDLVQPLRYGENPHQMGALCADPAWQGTSLVRAKQINGKELSYCNVLDLDGALALVMEFDEPAAVVVKHTTPCGCAVASSLASAFERAYAGDPLSAFGGIVALNRICDADTARAIIEGDKFLEAIVAPAFEADALRIITQENPKKWGKSIRLLETGEMRRPENAFELRSVLGGVLVQARDAQVADKAELKVVTKVKPDDATMRELFFAFTVVKHIKSNAICLTKDRQLLGFGGGSTSRVDSTEQAIRKAGAKAAGAALASDAFFPFPDSIELAAKAGVKAVIQPGGSVKDPDVIAAADAAGMTMVMTGMRHFKH